MVSTITRIARYVEPQIRYSAPSAAHTRQGEGMAVWQRPGAVPRGGGN